MGVGTSAKCGVACAGDCVHVGIFAVFEHGPLGEQTAEAAPPEGSGNLDVVGPHLIDDEDDREFRGAR
jgi:hypothetical protein